MADLRAATPSNAAELAVPDRNALHQNLDAMSDAMALAVKRQLARAGERLAQLASRPVLQSPLASFESRRKTLQLLESRLLSAETVNLNRKRQRFIATTAKLDAMSPLKVLTRGYAVASDADGNIIRSAGQVTPGDRIRVRVSDGTITANVLEGKTDHE